MELLSLFPSIEVIFLKFTQTFTLFHKTRPFHKIQKLVNEIGNTISTKYTSCNVSYRFELGDF